MLCIVFNYLNFIFTVQTLLFFIVVVVVVVIFYHFPPAYIF